MDRARVAVVGYGLAGSVFHAPLVAATCGLQLAAVVTANPGRRARAARDFPSAQILPTFEQLIDRAGEFELAVVATPNHLHAPQAVAALEHGLHVVVDKPVALGVGEAAAMAEAASGHRRILTVFQNRRLDNDFLLVHQAISEGRLGRVRHFESRFERWRPELRPGSWREELPPERGGGLLLDLGSHLIDQGLTLFGRPASVFAQLERRRETAAEDDCFLALTFDSGVMAHLWMSAATPVAGPRFRVWGERGALLTWGLDPQEAQLQAGMRPGSAGYGEASPDQSAELVEAGGREGEGTALPLPRGRYLDFYSGVAAAIASGAPPPVPAGAGIDVLRVVEAARASLAAGRPTPV